MARSLPDSLVSLLKNIPGVVIKTKLNSANFTVKKKVFAFSKGDAVVVKLPPAAVKRLVSGKRASLLVMGKRTMKEWVVIRYKAPSGCRKHLSLFREAMEYVAG